MTTTDVSTIARVWLLVLLLPAGVRGWLFSTSFVTMHKWTAYSSERRTSQGQRPLLYHCTNGDDRGGSHDTTRWSVQNPIDNNATSSTSASTTILLTTPTPASSAIIKGGNSGDNLSKNGSDLCRGLPPLQRRIHHSPDQVAKTTLGDIMSMGLITGTTSSSTTSTSTSSTASSEQSLELKYGISHPLDRMALTANGNLQRLVCSYYDSPVSVILDKQYRIESIQVQRGSYTNNATSDTTDSKATSLSHRHHVWHRVVHLTVFDQTFCTATSIITVRDPICQQLVESGQVGLGQLFRYLDLLPEFTLLQAGPMTVNGESEQHTTSSKISRSPVIGTGGGGNFWREYRLECNELSCWIREEFCPNLWDLQQPPSSSSSTR